MPDKITLDTNIVIYAFGRPDDVLNAHTLDLTITILSKYGFSFWDSMMVAAALDNQCSILYSEDLHHKQIIEGKLHIVNPFL